jgi:acylphosphatase
MDNKRARIIVNGLVQGVGYRYFVVRKAEQLGLKGYTQNLHTGEVLTEVEGNSSLINELIKLLRVGPSHAKVNNLFVEWIEHKNEFKSFEVKF